MAKSQIDREFLGVNVVRSGNISYRHVFDQIEKEIPFSEGLVMTTLPRGTLQIVQPPYVTESVLKGYSREFHRQDRLSWSAILQGRAMRAEECWPRNGFENSPYAVDFLRANGLRHAVVAPLEAPVLYGYPGAIHLYRSEKQGSFTNAELRKVGELAKTLDRLIESNRRSRLSGSCTEHEPWEHRTPIRHFVIDAQSRPQFPKGGLLGLDDQLQLGVLKEARERIHERDGQMVLTDRVQLPDNRGDHWTFRVIVHNEYPALGQGPYVFFCLTPECCDWSVVRPTDFQADSELARLIPAIQFMQKEFHRGPTLVETSAMVHLSPFHFHRRFTELLGLTPKHFHLTCQIYECKRQLMLRQKDLAQIAADCGFAHQSHFTSRFKQATGLTPTRWRRMAMELVRSGGRRD